MVCDTHINFLRLLYPGRQDLRSDARAFSLTSFETQSSSYDSIRPFNLFSKVSPGSE